MPWMTNTFKQINVLVEDNDEYPLNSLYGLCTFELFRSENWFLLIFGINLVLFVRLSVNLSNVWGSRDATASCLIMICFSFAPGQTRTLDSTDSAGRKHLFFRPSRSALEAYRWLTRSLFLSLSLALALTFASCSLAHMAAEAAACGMWHSQRQRQPPKRLSERSLRASPKRKFFLPSLQWP